MNNKIPCGGFYLSDTLGVDENGKLGVNGGEPYKSLVTDGDGGVKWEDRLAYTADPVIAEIFPEHTMTFSLLYGFYMSSVPVPSEFALVVGNPYTVKWDGTEYECVCSENGGEAYIGNQSIITGTNDTGEPFFISAAETLSFVTSNASSEHTVSISGYVETINKISEKYLPVASSGHYGVVDRDNIVVPYNFNSRYVVKSKIENALGEAQRGKAIVIWNTREILTSSFISAPGGGISVKFNDDPYATYTYKPQDGKYGITEKMYDISKYESIKYPKTFTLTSSTSGSTKKFKITIDDSGIISATEVTS